MNGGVVEVPLPSSGGFKNAEGKVLSCLINLVPLM